MKKLGLRAVAGSLAVLMVASVFAPAKVANAADMLVTAAAPKTLVITADMVDDDGEIVISNENWDRIVIGNDVVAKDIYFDGVDVDELVVESGSKSRVQLWEVDAAQVTVQEPEFNEITLNDILPLLADKETQQAALNMYMENKQANEAAAKLVPTIVTKEGAKVESVVARANATLDFAEGDVAVVALEASDKLDRAKVTLKNFDGDVTYKGNDKFSSMTLKNVNSTISLTVDESTENNYFTVTGKNSLVEKAEVAGNAQVALDAPMGVVEISEKATAAQVTILDTAEEMNVASKGAKVELTMNANVAVATVTADNVKVEGQGTLKEAVLEGKGAYVSTNGTKVEGENTYVKPVYVEKPEDIEYMFATLGAGGWGYTRLGSTDGGETYKLNANYGGEVFYKLPKSVDACMYSEAVIKVKAEEGQQVTVKLTHEGADKDSYGNPVPFFSKTVSGEAEVVVPLALHAGKMIDQVRFQSTGNEVTATFFDVTFKLNPNGPVEPLVPPTDGTLCNNDGWKLVAFNTDFRQFAGKNVKITVEAIRLGGSADLAANGQFEPEYGTGIHWGKEITSEWTDFGIESWTVPADWASKTAPIYYAIRNVDGVDYAQSLIYYRNFSVEVLEDDTTGDTTPTPEPEDPKEEVDLTGATKCTTDAYQVHHFTDYNIAEYAGKEITFSVDMVRVGGDASTPIVAQDSAYGAMYVDAVIGEEWDTYTYTITVPADYADKETAYLGFRWKSGPVDNYADYEFYFKNFKLTVAGEEEPEDDVDLTGATKCTTDAYQVHHFTDYNLVEYAGKEITFSVDMVRVGGDASTPIVAQDSAYSAMYKDAVIGEEWDTYTYTITVPADYADKETAYLGFRWKSGPVDNFADYAFYFKNFTFTAEEESETVVAKTYNFTNLAMWYKDGATSEVDANGAMSATYEGQYKAVQYAMPTDINTMEYTKMVFNVVSPDGKFALKVWEKEEVPGENNSSKIIAYVDPVATATDIEIDISDATNVIEKVDFMSTKDAGDGAYPYTVTVNSITFK